MILCMVAKFIARHFETMVETITLVGIYRGHIRSQRFLAGAKLGGGGELVGFPFPFLVFPFPSWCSLSLLGLPLVSLCTPMRPFLTLAASLPPSRELRRMPTCSDVYFRGFPSPEKRKRYPVNVGTCCGAQVTSTHTPPSEGRGIG